MKTFSLILTTVVLTSCKSDAVKPISFHDIDLTYSDGWTKLVSIYLDSTKTLKIRIDEHLKGIHYYGVILPDSSFNKISLFAERALKIDHDSFINERVPDGGGYSLMLTSKNKKINSTVYCAGTCYKPLDTLVFELLKLSQNIKQISTDTLFGYKSYNRFGPPPPLLKEMVKFVPPVIKDYQIDNAGH